MSGLPPVSRAASGGGPSFGEEDRRLSYGSYLKIPELLRLQQPLTDAHDELLFITIHQAYELWFKLVLYELESAREAMQAGDCPTSQWRLKRVTVIESLLIHQVDVLDTMAPQDFLQFRHRLAPASGFQSVQFREIEFLSGLKDPAYLRRLETDSGERARLERRLAEPSLADAFAALLEASGSSIESLFNDHARRDLFQLSESLLEHDQAFSLWRARHVQMVERQIGSKTGTGGSTGSSYLRSRLDKRFFPELWAARSSL